MALKLYDLALADPDIRPSPFCWMVKFALLHKGLEFETAPVGFADKANYPDPEYGRVPVIIDGEETVKDSAMIMAWLDKAYPENPLVATDGEAAAAEFSRAWLFSSFFPAVSPMLVARIHALAADDDKPYFRASREERFGKTIEELAATTGQKEKVEASLQVLSAPLGRYRFLGGDAPNLCDYYVMGAFMWPRLSTSEDIYEAPQPVAAWIERMLDLFDGYARKAKRPS
ncbi:glutathione S-transferase N-terminal domain-containing protein [Hyphococcus sp.]|uniref:glutathione S-transferase N-terminal domain-containing protein n=1 Tax=Hyphococcus sp. TaxID=2038636 RepID=UPI0035C6ACEC